MAGILPNIIAGSGGAIYINNNVKTQTGYTPNTGNNIADKNYVDNAIALKAPKGIIDGIYNNAGTADTILSTTFTVGSVALAIETVGAFTANLLYQCTAAGTILTGTFEEIALSDGLLIISQYELINPNDTNVIFSADTPYAYDTGTNTWVFKPQLDSIAAGTSFQMSCTFEHSDSGTPISLGFIPLNSVIEGVANLFCETTLDGSAATLGAGDASDNSKIMSTTALYTSLHDFVRGSCTGEMPLCTTTFTPIVYTNRTEIFVYFNVTGASQGKFHLTFKCRKI